MEVGWKHRRHEQHGSGGSGSAAAAAAAAATAAWQQRRREQPYPPMGSPYRLPRADTDEVVDGGIGSKGPGQLHHQVSVSSQQLSCKQANPKRKLQEPCHRKPGGRDREWLAVRQRAAGSGAESGRQCGGQWQAGPKDNSSSRCSR